jgi:hypothetical protein
MMRTYLHLLQSAKVFRSRVGYENEAVDLGLGVRTGETTAARISKECKFGRAFVSPYDGLDDLWYFSLGHDLTFAELRKHIMTWSS